MAAYIRKLEDANGNDQYPVTKAAAVYTEAGDTVEEKITELETTTAGITFGIVDGEYGYYKPGTGGEMEFVGFKSQADVDAAAQSGYDSGYAQGQADLKVERKLTLTDSQTGSNIDIPDNWYTAIDASAVYKKGKTDAIIITKTTTGWFNPTTVGSTYDYKTVNIASDYSEYQDLTANNLVPFIAQFSGQGGDNYTVIVGSYNASNGDVSIGCNGHLNNVHVALVIKP